MIIDGQERQHLLSELLETLAMLCCQQPGIVVQYSFQSDRRWLRQSCYVSYGAVPCLAAPAAGRHSDDHSVATTETYLW